MIALITRVRIFSAFVIFFVLASRAFSAFARAAASLASDLDLPPILPPSRPDVHAFLPRKGGTSSDLVGLSGPWDNGSQEPYSCWLRIPTNRFREPVKYSPGEPPMATEPAQPPAQISRSNKPDSLKLEVWTRHAPRQTNSQIARDLGIARNTVAKIIAERHVEQVEPADAARALSRAGITPETIAQKLRQGMEATETKLATWEGKFTDRVEVPDNSARFRYVEAGAKILSMFPDASPQLQAQLILKLPSRVILPGHGEDCTCQECIDAWEAGAQASPAIESQRHST